MSVDRARLVIAPEDGIAEHPQAIIDMKCRLNSLALTAILPPELLAEVFLHLAHSTLSTTHHSPLSSIPQAAPVESPYTWLQVTHVCHHWREVALSAPQLWSTVCDNGSIESLREIISRSKHVPLSIDARRGLLCTEGLNLIMRELPRIVAFNARLPPHLGLTGHDQDAKNLKELTLHTSDEYGVPPLGLIRLRDHFAVCELPSLERLELCENQIPWNSKLIRPTLKHLTLQQMQDHDGRSLEEILQILATLPLLETLSLTDCFPISPVHTQDHVTNIVDLPNLRQVHLSAGVSECKAFLQHVSFPSNASRALKLFVDDSDDLEALIEIALCNRDVQRAAKAAEVGKGTGYPLLRSLDLGYNWEDHVIRLWAWPTFHSLQEMHTKPKTLPDPFLDIFLECPSSMSLFDLLRTLLNPELESLLLIGELVLHPINKAEWRQAFERLPQLRELGLGKFAKDLGCEILDHHLLLTPVTPDASVKSGKKRRSLRQPCVPHLEVLEVALWGETETFLERLRKSLAARKKARVELKTVIIQASPAYLVEEDADGLREYVGSLEVTDRDWEYDEDGDEDEDVWDR